MIWLQNDSKGHRPELIVYHGGDMTLLIHEGDNEEYLFLKDCTIHDTSSTDNSQFEIFQIIIKQQLESGETDKWNNIFNIFMGVSEETSPLDHHMYNMDKKWTNHQRL